MAGHLAQTCPVASPDDTNEQVLTLFSENQNMGSLPVVENGLPMGIINRNQFMSQLAKPFHREVYARKSCIAFMDTAPLVVEHDVSLQELSFMAVANGEKALADGFIVTRDHQYIGIGAGVDLVKAIADLQAEKNRLVMESINYASVIQKSFLRSSREDMAAALNDYFMHWEPRDVVGGDYYYFVKHEDGFFCAVIDCTGHGVPGAFMTLIIASALNQVLKETDLHDPATALAEVNRTVKQSLGQFDGGRQGMDGDDHEMHSDDGMDTAFCWVDTRTRMMTFAGAKTPLFLLPPGADDLDVIKGDKKGVGYIDTPMDYCWENQKIALKPGSQVYITTDGIIDQIGGPKQISFGKKRLKKVIMDAAKQPMSEQKEHIMQAFYKYQGDNRRRDDVSIFGFRID
ncbi:protein-serine/threonine phosphatase [Aquaspirillum sp. LM1]|nr:protein-serine/threonine phosphatase [Aquaspirillum sp. LM1]